MRAFELRFLCIEYVRRKLFQVFSDNIILLLPFIPLHTNDWLEKYLN